MQEQSDKKYGLLVAITMVVGVVIGSGIFFTTGNILSAARYNVILGLIALIIGAFAMVFGSIVFGIIASRSKKTGGLVNYMEQTFGKRASYTIGVFQATIFLPAITSILAWVSARYLLILFGVDAQEAYNGVYVWVIAVILLVSFYIFNYLKPKLSGKIHVVVTFVPFIPLLFVGIVATIAGVRSGTLQDNFQLANRYFQEFKTVEILSILFTTTVLTTFAYEGWVVATNIESEIKDSKKNLPKALLIGTLIVATMYVLFYIGMVSFVYATNMIDDSVMYVVKTILGSPIWGVLMIFFIFISCIGTLNGLVVGSIRAPYLIASNGWGFKPKSLNKTNQEGLSKSSSIYGCICTLIMLIILILNSNGGFNFLRLLGINQINLMAFPIVVLYMGYILMYLYVMAKYKDLNLFKRFVMPILAILGGSIILIGGFMNPEILIGIIISVVFLLIAQLGYKKDNSS